MRGRTCQIFNTAILTVLCLTPIFSAQISVSNDVSAASLRWDAPFQKCWEYGVSGGGAAGDEAEFQTPITDHQRTLFLPFDDGSVAALESDAGKILWRTQFGGRLAARPLFARGKLYLLSKIVNAGGRGAEFVLRAVSPATGLTFWQKNLAFGNSSAPTDSSVLSGETEAIYLATDGNDAEPLLVISGGGQIQAFAPNDGGEIWRRDLRAKISAEPFVSGERIFVGRADNKISVLSAAAGADAAEFPLRRAPTGNFAVSETAGREIFVAGDRAGGIYAFRLSDRKLVWRARAGAQIYSVASAGGNFLVSSLDGFVYLLDGENGDRIWKKRLAGRPLGSILSNDEFVLVQTLDGNAAPVYEISGGRAVNRIQFEQGAFSNGGAIALNRKIILPTNRGLFAFSPVCAEK